MSINSDLLNQERLAQIAFEEESDEKAFELLLSKRSDDLLKRGDEDRVVSRLILNAYEGVKRELEEVFESSGNSQYIYINKQVGAEVISALALTLVFRRLLSESEATFQTLSSMIGRAIVTESMIYQVEQISPLYARRVAEGLEDKAVKNPRHIQGVYTKALSTITDNDIEYSLTTSDYIHLGKYALDAVYNAGIMQLDRRFRNGKELALYSINEALDEHIRSPEGFKQYFRISGSGKYMTVKPDDWTNLHDGGFLSTRRKKTNSLMVNFKLGRKTRREILREFNADNYPLVFETVNYIQSMAFRVNEPTLDLVKEIWENDLGLFGITKRDYPNFRDFPFPKEWDKEKATEEELKVFLAWCRGKADWFTNKKKHSSKVYDVYNVVNSIPKDKTLYFPVYCDSRNRYYYNATLNPQGDDLHKALLHLNTKKKLGTRGLYWLKVHLANSLGFDDCRMDLRVAYIDENWEQIELALKDPLGMSEVFGDESPLVAYSTAYEIKKALDSGDPENYETGIVVHMDATVSGTQHFSAMLRDPVGAMFTNLIDNGTDKKSDLYMHVASKVMEKVAEDLAEAHKEWREFWLGHGISRNMAKKPVMTFNYAVTKITVADYVREVLAEEGVDSVDGKTSFYLADKIFEGVAEAIPATYQGMEFLKGCAREKGEVVITWTTPIGFKVYHDRPKVKQTRLKVRSAGVTQVVSKEYVDGCDKSDMVSAIAPNFIHSYDSAHLSLTALGMKDRGLEGVFIHDSIGTHPCDVDALNKIVREKFVDMYRGNVMQDLKESLGVEIEAPVQGTFDLENVKSSEFFFS